MNTRQFASGHSDVAIGLFLSIGNSLLSSGRRVNQLSVGFVAAIGLLGNVQAQTNNAPLLQKGDLIYQGAFRVPDGGTEATTFNYGGTAIAYNPNKNSLFLVGHIYKQRTAEISIPSLVNSTRLSDLNTATILQPFTDSLEGKLSQVNPSDPNSQIIGDHLVYNGKLYTTVYSYYDGAGTQTRSHFVRPLDLSTRGQVIGPIKVGNTYPGWVSGYMATIPTAWQSVFGGPALTGNFGLAIVSIQSWGPAASVFDPADIGSKSVAPATQIVGYPDGNGVLGADYGETNPYFNGSTRGDGLVFPEGSRSILFFGRHGIGEFCYGGAECNDPADSDKGVHAYPYKYQVWAYDANDLAKVKAGSVSPADVQPYKVWTFNIPLEDNGTHDTGGVAYDRANGLIYFAQLYGDGALPIIHAFRINQSPAPNPPSALQVN